MSADVRVSEVVALDAIMAKLKEARRTLLHPVRRILYDAEIRNSAGVARVLAGGVSAAQLHVLQQEFAHRFPARVRHADQLATEVNALIKAGEWRAAMDRIEEGLGEDPLSPALHRQSAIARRVLARIGGSETPPTRGRDEGPAAVWAAA